MLLTSLIADLGSLWQRPGSGGTYPFVASTMSAPSLLDNRYAHLLTLAGGFNSLAFDVNTTSGQPFMVSLATGSGITSVIPDWDVRPRWRDGLMADIAEYVGRAEGWDGFEARPIDPLAISDARQFVSLLPDEVPPPLDQPCADGEVSLIWRFGDSFAEVSFPGDHTFYWYCTNGSEEDACEGIPITAGLPAELSLIMGFDLDRRNPIETSSEISVTAAIPDALSRVMGFGVCHATPIATSQAPFWGELRLAA